MSTLDQAALGERLIALRHELHRFPELSNQEFETTARLRQQLEQHQIRILDLPLKTGLVAEIGSSSGPLVVLRSDIDALPIEEQSGVSFRSERAGVMHACGHDFHCTAALGAAILLKQQEASLSGRVRILFQPAEETGQGAPAVIATGALADARVIFGLHNDPSLPAGVIGSKAGPLTAAVDRFDISITGIGSHAAKPHQGNDPIVIAAQIVAAAQTLISRNAPSADNAVVSITQIHSGSTWNVIPEGAWLEGTVRSFSQPTRERLEQRFRTLVAGIGAAFDAQISFNWQAGPPSVVNDAYWTEVALQQASASGFEARVVEASPIGEDFAFYQQQLPGAFMMIGTGEPYALHHPAFRINDAVLLPTARYLADLARTALTLPEPS
ncbi:MULTISPECIES: amidohydrolase [Pantoea]|jgi:amidohydrolase|uniref:Amidohydrolase n=1 Tax=Pantoea brenneri TaxID=472694 RepID=A0A7Y6TQY8_9GAMM|nr:MULTISPECIES: amidohydrolase [Pantoea]MBZ6393841.1 amidohydrolase [Pantoea sp.]MBZ6436781.1 amidohydrolase [Pantoea sp.]MCQ5473112.1 amidohydrolase [Pantoea brenneri]MDU4125564.1 amidohydrolase [Pantoea sp.]MDU4744990.1 amidohydrolase [Pantoea sp.]